MVKNEGLKMSSSLCFQGDSEFCIPVFYYSVSKKNIHFPHPHKEIKLITNRNEGLEPCSPLHRLTESQTRRVLGGHLDLSTHFANGKLAPYKARLCQSYVSWQLSKGSPLGLSHHPASLLAAQDEIPDKAKNSSLHSGKPGAPLLPLFTAQLPKQFDSIRHRARDPNHVFSLELWFSSSRCNYPSYSEMSNRGCLWG